MRLGPLLRTVRCAALAWRSGGCCAAILLRGEGSIPFPWPLLRQARFPTNHYHRRSSGLTAGCLKRLAAGANDKEVSFGRNSQSQSSGARPRRRKQWRRRHALHHGLHAVAAGCPAGLPIFFQTQNGANPNDGPDAGTDGCFKPGCAGPSRGRSDGTNGYGGGAGCGGYAGCCRVTRDRNDGRERAVQNCSQQSRRTGEALDSEEVLRHGRQAAGHGAAAGRGAVRVPALTVYL